MLCITPRTLHCLRTEGHFGLLSTFRIGTMVRNIGHTSVEDDKKKAKGLKIFQILPSEGMGSKAEIRFCCVKNSFIRFSVWYLFIIASSCKKFN